MKRTLLALTLGGLLSSTGALASNVEVYGVLDYGLTWQQNDAVDGTSESSLKMLSGQYIGSRVGIKGSEDLGNGLKRFRHRYGRAGTRRPSFRPRCACLS